MDIKQIVIIGFIIYFIYKYVLKKENTTESMDFGSVQLCTDKCINSNHEKALVIAINPDSNIELPIDMKYLRKGDTYICPNQNCSIIPVPYFDSNCLNGICMAGEDQINVLDGQDNVVVQPMTMYKCKNNTCTINTSQTNIQNIPQQTINTSQTNTQANTQTNTQTNIQNIPQQTINTTINPQPSVIKDCDECKGGNIIMERDGAKYKLKLQPGTIFRCPSDTSTRCYYTK